MNISFSTIRSALLDLRALSLFVLIAILLTFSLYLLHRSTKHFSEAYKVYADLVATQDNRAYLPAAVGNPIRQRLNQILTETLAETTEPQTRIARAKLGLEVLKEAEVQINEIGDRGGPVDEAVEEMDANISSVRDFFSGGKMRKIVDLAKRRAETISQIRGLSYRANFETAKIFDRIVADGGILTDAHILELNSEIPEVEKQFDERSHLYVELEKMSKEIMEHSAAFNGF